MKRLSPVLVTMVCAVSLVACEVAPDSVDPGFYGACDCDCKQAGTAGSNLPSSNLAISSVPNGYAGNPGSSSPTPSEIGNSGSGQTPTEGPHSVATTSDNPDSYSEGGPLGSNSPNTEGGGKCDMTGRWLVMERGVTDALGQFQLVLRWMYYEIKQEGDSFEVTKGLLCGDEGIGLGLFAVTADFKKTWDGCRERMRLDGRTGTSVPANDGGCRIHFDRFYTVRGATLPYYLDPSVPMPTLEQRGTDSAPGWEDWDEDGNPGLTGYVSGVVTGQIYVAPRRRTELEGTAPDLSSTVTLSMQWDQEPNLVSYSGSPLMTSQAARASDPSLHFAQIARLTSDQATGDNAAICAAIHELAPSLTPKAISENL